MAIVYITDSGSGATNEDTGTAAPTTGYWTKGWRRWNTSLVAGGAAGWICVAAGTPGTWVEFALISAS